MKRAVAAILACLLLISSALAEAADFVAEAPSVAEEGSPALAPEEAVPEFNGILSANDEGADESEAPAEVEPTTLAYGKNKTKTVWLGTAYRFTVPGKAVKSYASSAKKVATVDKTGLIALKKVGTAKITAKLKNGKKVVLTLKVADPLVPASVVIGEGKKAALTAGDALRLTATVSPATAPQDVTWRSNKPAVATVDDSGLVTAVKSGTATITAATANKKTATFAVTVSTPPYMISHAMGGIDGIDYSNCLEAFLENYAEGHRIFEVDFEITSDGQMVLLHNWKRKMFSAHTPGKKTTYAQFMAAKIYDKYTPLDIDDLLKLMRDYPDVTIITDSKYTDQSTIKKQFTTLVGKAKALGLESVLDRMVVEIYNKKMLTTVKGVHKFNAYIFTLYKLYSKAPSASQLKSICEFCKKNGVYTVAMPDYWWKSSYLSIIKKYDLDAALYTTNSASAAKKYFKQGVTALWTDYLPPV